MTNGLQKAHDRFSTAFGFLAGGEGELDLALGEGVKGPHLFPPGQRGLGALFRDRERAGGGGDLERLFKRFTLDERGLPTDRLPSVLRPGDTLYAVGPEPMMAAARAAEATGLPAYVSLEAAMACGVESCLSCRVELKRGPVHICKRGSVFPVGEVFFAKPA